MELHGISVVLARPEESRNIGAVCRALANSGINSLRIVGQRENYDDEKIRVLAIHAADIWEKAVFFSSITDACADCVFSAGTTRRRGKNRKGKLLLPEELAEQASSLSGGRCAVVFGNERTGLIDSELAECTIGVTIPASAGFASLNLSHAVQIICYTLFRSAKHFSPGSISIPLSRLDKTVGAITRSLAKIGFFTQTPPTAMEQFWRNILSRAALSEGEAAYLEHVFTKAAGLAGQNLSCSSDTYPPG
ncbi:MAG: RNA methyltransferase [Treponema sp.]|jgi:tRNA/rRNA methyltransferase|nr:RNA methyltransferase [Treponema sp.]